MAVVTITKDNFEAEVLGCKIPVVLDFWAEWCEPCKMQSTVIEELAAELDGKVKFGKVNVDEEASLALNYQIMSIPTLVVMHYGLFQGKAIGVQGNRCLTTGFRTIDLNNSSLWKSSKTKCNIKTQRSSWNCLNIHMC